MFLFGSLQLRTAPSDPKPLYVLYNAMYCQFLLESSVSMFRKTDRQLKKAWHHSNCKCIYLISTQLSFLGSTACFVILHFALYSLVFAEHENRWCGNVQHNCILKPVVFELIFSVHGMFFSETFRSFLAETFWSLKHFGHLSHSYIKTRHKSVF